MQRKFFSFLFIAVLAFPIEAQTNGELYEKCLRENQGYKEQLNSYNPIVEALLDEMGKSGLDKMFKLHDQISKINEERRQLNKLFNKSVKRCINRERSLLTEEKKRIADYNEKVDYFTKKANELNQIGNRDALSKKLLNQNLDILASINKTAFSDLMNELAKFDDVWSSKKRIQSNMYSDMEFLQANSYDASIADFDNREIDSNSLESELNDLRNNTNNIGSTSVMTPKRTTSSPNYSSGYGLPPIPDKYKKSKINEFESNRVKTNRLNNYDEYDKEEEYRERLERFRNMKTFTDQLNTIILSNQKYPASREVKLKDLQEIYRRSHKNKNIRSRRTKDGSDQ